MNKKLIWGVVITVVVIAGIVYALSTRKYDCCDGSQQKAAMDVITKDWKTYTDDTIGFSFKYPEVMGVPTVRETPAGREVSFENSVAFTVSAYWEPTLGRNLSLAEIVDKEMNSPNYVNPTKKDIVVDGKKGVEISYQDEVSGGSTIITYIELDTKDKMLVAYQYGRTVSMVSGSVGINEIFPTFKFTSPTPAVKTEAPKPVSTTPSIQVISPNGGEKYKIGDMVNISWISRNLGSSSINIAWCRVNSGCNNIITRIPNSGNYSWKIPSNFLVGDYKIVIGNDDINSQAEDQSDNYLTITN